MFKYIDLFAGCGGLTEGFQAAGDYEGLAHVEWEIPMVNTLRYRLNTSYGYGVKQALKRVIHFDIQHTEELLNGFIKFNGKSIYSNNHETFISHGLNGVINSEIDLVIGGPPCQAYSIAGRAQDKNSMKDDYRNYLFESFASVVNEFKPKLFVFENVPGILSATPGDIPVLKRIYDAFDEINYEIRTPNKQKESLFNSNDFNVAQNRKRVIIIGVRKDLKLSLEDIYKSIEDEKDESKPVLMDVIRHLPKIYPNGDNNSSHSQKEGLIVPFHNPRKHNPRDISIFKEWTSKSMNSLSTADKLEYYFQKTGKKSNHNKYRSLEWGKPGPTIVSHLKKDGLLFIHPDSDKARTITVKEAALIQSFPDDFEFIGNQGDQYKMIGNAVPPNMANAIARALKKYLQ